MRYILKKSAPALTIRAGHLAQQHILQHGLQAQDVDIIPGAAGGPKGIGIFGLDQAIFENFLTQAPKRRTLIGSSIGAWRFASITAWGASEGLSRLADLYTHLYFDKHMSMHDIGKICQQMLLDLVQGREQHMLNHPDYHLTIISAKARHLFQSDRALPLLASVAGIIGTNALSRKNNRLFMQRVISQPAYGAQFQVQDEFTTHYHPLNPDNILSWLMASASIPGVMNAVNNIPDAKGSYRDGGLIDYHLDLDFNSQGIVLYPHFTDSITPGWFDKMIKRRAKPSRQARTLLIAPSPEYLASLPLGRLPDRKDFSLKGLDQATRIKFWQQSVSESQRLGDEFLELIEQQNLAAVMQNFT
ncbi:patatin-like phospholipase family protein [Acinetobacter sp. B51(2017)]|uniref:patatin-like phospholipase family protein n=1 Tax=Acinetobacter sp. B51(2017) TaxID=2060938 RepID=UPI000F0946FF|nr:patatin-like phospholipase family protein [Acinetobacter sp. B51(2017)]